MTLRVVQVNCVVDPEDRSVEDLLSAWPTLPNVAEAVARAGAEVTVLQASRKAAEHHRKDVAYRFVGQSQLGRGGTRAVFSPWRLASAAAREAPHVIHFNGLDSPYHARVLTRLGLPMLVQDHASCPQSRVAQLRRWGYARVAAAAFTAAEQAEPFVRAGQLPRTMPIFEIPESSSHFMPGDRAKARAATGVFGNPAALWVGRLNANKDPLTVLHAVRKILHKLPELHLWCAFGEADLLPVIEALLRSDANLAAHVHLLGRVPHGRIEQLCRGSDLFVSASRREGSGYALIEALACGLPCVVSDIAPFQALTGRGTAGALVPVGDSDAFAAAIGALAKQPREPLRAKVVAHFERNLSFDVLGARLVDAYSTLVSGAPRR